MNYVTWKARAKHFEKPKQSWKKKDRAISLHDFKYITKLWSPKLHCTGIKAKRQKNLGREPRNKPTHLQFSAFNTDVKDT